MYRNHEFHKPNISITHFGISIRKYINVSVMYEYGINVCLFETSHVVTAEIKT